MNKAGISSVPVCAGLLSAALCGIALLLAHPPDRALAASTKPFATFEDFYPLCAPTHKSRCSLASHFEPSDNKGLLLAGAAATWSSTQSHARNSCTRLALVSSACRC
eukprot:COSAG03_NODE_1511_length_3952_cov_10.484817_6_plen_107_part_00